MPIRKRAKTGEPDLYLGLIEGIIEADPESGYSRSFLLIDCVRSDVFSNNPEAGMRELTALSLVKVMSTPRRLNELFGPLAVGEWVSLELVDSSDLPLAWELRASENYQTGPRRSVRNIRRLGGQRKRAGQGDGGLVTQLVTASKWASNSRASVPARDFARKYLSAGNVEIVVLDVGQAAATLIKRDGLPIGLFDAGAPIWFNNGSLAKDFDPPVINDGFVFLSHWDFDHFDLGRRNVAYQNLQWFAPNQPVGPNTAFFQGKLGSNLTFVDGSAVYGGFRLSRGTSSVTNDRNGTGYQLRYQRFGKAVLLTGDTDYSLIRPSMKSNLFGLTIPHHAGRGTAPPISVSGGKAIASYGLPNSYRHPCAETIDGHVRAKWKISHTATYGPIPRGNRILYP